MRIGAPYSEYEMMYLAKFYEQDGSESIASLFGRNPKAISQKFYYLREKDLLEHYRSLWDKEDVNALERR